MAVRSRLLIFALLAVLPACRKPADPLTSAVNFLVVSANRRDRDAILRKVAPDFQAEDGSSRAEIDSRLRQIFAAYDTLQVVLSGLTIERGNEVALARFRLVLSGSPTRLGGLDSLLPRSSTYRFELRLTPDGGDWRVAWARWEEQGQ
jgi:hypothetical protein